MKTLGTLLILTATMLATPAAAQADDESAKRPNCRNFYETDTGHDEPGALDKWVDTRTKLYARHCIGVTGRHWVDPIWVEFTYNVEHAHESCGFFDDFEGVRYDLYIQDGAGRNFHEPTVTLNCDESTEGYDLRTLRLAPNFTYCGTPPRWHTHYTIKINNANDVSGTHKGYLWGFTGPVRDQC